MWHSANQSFHDIVLPSHILRNVIDGSQSMWHVEFSLRVQKNDVHNAPVNPQKNTIGRRHVEGAYNIAQLTAMLGTIFLADVQNYRGLRKPPIVTIGDCGRYSQVFLIAVINDRLRYCSPSEVMLVLHE
jgi:hypothetical protein